MASHPRPVRRPAATRLDDYGLVGNLHTAILVSRAGSVDWACLPRFASPSVFARLLDARRGGFHEIRPATSAAGRQTYLPSTAILETTFALPRRRSLRLLDFLPISPQAPEHAPPVLVRVAEAYGGPVDVQVQCEPRFDYGRYEARWEHEGDGRWTASNGRSAITYFHREPLEVVRGRAVSSLVLRPEEPVAIEIGWGRSGLLERSVSELLRETETFWLDWVHRSDTPLHLLAGRWHQWVERSEITLKLLNSADTGAFVAAPTTSLPEWPGGTRNWDYRYAWVRDAAFTAEALLLLGHVREASRFLRWVVGRIDERAPAGPLRVVYADDGVDQLEERTLDHLRGFAGSRPVRIGNGAAIQFQMDIYGELLDAAYLLSFAEPKEVERLWPRLTHVADEVLDRWREPDRGIWEARAAPRHYVHSKLMAWVALERSVRLAKRFGQLRAVSAWQAAAAEIREEILARGYDARRETFVQSFGRRELDAAALRIPIVGFLPFDDPRVLSTIESIDRALADGPFLYRYRGSDGIRGPEATFLPCAFWMVECLARSGRRASASQRFEDLLGAASPTGLFSEEFDPARRRLLGNYPQGLSHIGLLRAALALGLAELAPTAGAVGDSSGLARLRRALRMGEPPAWED